MKRTLICNTPGCGRSVTIQQGGPTIDLGILKELGWTKSDTDPRHHETFGCYEHPVSDPVRDPMRDRAQIDAEIIAANSPTPDVSAARKATPIFSGVMAYFPNALEGVARLSQAGNDKHNPGEDLHWARGKSMDHADCIARHLLEWDEIDPEDEIPHVYKVAWRALALAQQYAEEHEGAPMSRGSR